MKNELRVDLFTALAVVLLLLGVSSAFVVGYLLLLILPRLH